MDNDNYYFDEKTGKYYDKFRYLKQGDEYVPMTQIIEQRQQELEKSMQELDRITDMWDSTDDYEME